jgi:multidrug efflux pump subunit AcrB
VASVSDGTDINFGCAIVNGKRSLYIPIVKQNTASTLTVVNQIHESMARFQSVLPESVKISYEFDESPAVKEAIKSVAIEGLIGATLTGLMILLFLQDWRSVLVVVFNIPMAILGSLFALWLTGNTINIMTLGGLALSIGMLVDEATVSIENIHVQMTHSGSLARAVERGSNETAVPRLLAMLCILSVFIPAFIMAEPVRSLFVPLALAVGFAMVSSYLLSSTVVPVLSVWLLKHHGGAKHEDDRSLFGRVQRRFEKAVSWTVAWRRIVVPVYLGVCALVLFVVGPQLGTELFPQVDPGEFVLRFRAPPGTNFELTREMWVRCLQIIDEEAGPGKVEISMGFAGQQAPNYAMNNMILFMRGPDDAQMRIKFIDGSGIRLDEFRERLRKALPERLVPWFTRVLEREGLPGDLAAERARHITFGFEPGDIVSEVMSFGSPAPIEITVASPDLEKAREHAQAIEAQLRKIPYLRDVQIQQTLNYPTVPVIIDRQKAGLSGVTTKQIGDSVLVTTSSSRMVARNFWQDPRSGASYQVQIEVPTQRMDSAAQVENIPLEEVNTGLNLMLRDVARVGQGFMPGEYDRTSMQRYVSVTANVEGEDLGRAARQVEIALREAGKPPRGVHVETRGQIDPMEKMFESLGIGLVVAVCVILVLLTAYFQAWRASLISVGAVPGVLSGVVLILYLTHTTLNIESFMGTIMCIGVSVSNSVMLVTFTARDWQQGSTVREAAVRGATERLRPIMMTACAMIVGMIPMSLALESGSQMEAPLGRAVIGGLLVSTFGTLLLLPPIFAVVMGSLTFVSPSLHPDDGDSRHFDAAGVSHQETTSQHPQKPETSTGSQEHA